METFWLFFLHKEGKHGSIMSLIIILFVSAFLTFSSTRFRQELSKSDLEFFWIHRMRNIEMDTDKCIYSVTSLSALLQKIFSLCSTNLEVEGKNYLFFKKLANGQFALELKRRKKERQKEASGVIRSLVFSHLALIMRGWKLLANNKRGGKVRIHFKSNLLLFSLFSILVRTSIKQMYSLSAY